MEQLVSVVLPVHNECENLAPLMSEISDALRDRSYEIVAVDDGSTDGSRAELQRLQSDYATLRVIALAGRYGQSAALLAGFEAAQGDLVVTLDADGQNDPSEIPALVDRLAEEPTLAAVAGFRVRRADSVWKRIQSRTANTARNWITGDRVRDTGCGLKVLRPQWLRQLPRFDGMHRFLPTLIRRAGGRVIELPVTHRRRYHGRSKYGMWDRAFRGLYDALAVRWLRHRAVEYEVREEDC